MRLKTWFRSYALRPCGGDSRIRSGRRWSRREPSGNPEELAFGEGNPQRPVGCPPEIVACRIGSISHSTAACRLLAHGGDLPEPPWRHRPHRRARRPGRSCILVFPVPMSAPCFAVGVPPTCPRPPARRPSSCSRFAVSVTAEARRFARFAAVVAPWSAVQVARSEARSRPGRAATTVDVAAGDAGTRRRPGESELRRGGRCSISRRICPSRRRGNRSCLSRAPNTRVFARPRAFRRTLRCPCP